MDYQQILNEIFDELPFGEKQGEVANYIPELAKVNPNDFAVFMTCIDGRTFSLGEPEQSFSAQSITKVFSLCLAMKLLGDAVFERVDVEPSGTSFNSLVLLEYENGIPRNPFINSGALVIADMLVRQLDNPKKEFLAFVRHLSGDASIDYNPAVAASEATKGFRNRSLANLLKSFGNINAEVEEVLDFYYHQCSLELNCCQLAKAFIPFANGGKNLANQRLITPRQSQRINALMQTCGFYDEAGEFAFRVGLPGKSGVGGGIVAVHPGAYSVAVYSPRLNPQGNSVLGMETLERLTTKTGMAIF